jgi:hypothetical protein
MLSVLSELKIKGNFNNIYDARYNIIYHERILKKQNGDFINWRHLVYKMYDNMICLVKYTKTDEDGTEIKAVYNDSKGVKFDRFNNRILIEAI